MNSVSNHQGARRSRRLFWAGGSCVGFAVLYGVAALAQVLWAFNTIAESTTQPKPAELAAGIPLMMVLGMFSALLGVAGFVLLVIGLVLRNSGRTEGS